MRRRRGFLLVLCLLMASLVFVMGIGFLGNGSSRYNAATQARTSTQAHHLAMAGIEDARVKIQKDPQFPPSVEADTSNQQVVYTYNEVVTDFSGTTLGSYLVTIDQTYQGDPHWILRVTSRGKVGPLPNQPAGESVIHADFDIHPITPGTAHPRDANFVRIVNWWEEAQ